MIKTYAVIKDELVVNKILLDPVDYDTYVSSLGDQTNLTFIEVDDLSHISIGWSYINNEFISNQPIENNESFVLEQVLQVANT